MRRKQDLSTRTEKRCPRCKEVKPRALFHKAPTADGMSAHCKACRKLYTNELRERGVVTPGTAERFWRKVDKNGPGGCWLFKGGLVPDGYGLFHYGGRLRPAHHIPMLLDGKEPPKYPMVCDHLCRVRNCVNPDHIRVVTQGVNTLENSNSNFAKNRQKTHCSKCGNPYSGTNLAVVPRVHRRNGKTYYGRQCLTCYPGAWRFAVVPRPRPPGSRVKRTDPDYVMP